MAALFSFRWSWRIVGLSCLALSVVLMTGCEPDPYSSDLEYANRDDVVVIKVNEQTNLPYVDQPGEFNTFFANLKALANTDPKRDLDLNKLPPALAKLKKEGFVVVDPDALDPKVHSQLDRYLKNTFGKPANPVVRVDAEVKPTEYGWLGELRLADDKQLAKGSILYRRHCLHCHGVTGDGRGPTAAWVNPHPRDYRSGIFKFSSSKGEKPSRKDLKRTLIEGVESTSMPSFKLLKDEELEALVSYVIHLSIRGEVELSVIKSVLSDGSLNTTTMLESPQKMQEELFKKDGVGINSTFNRVLEAWRTSNHPDSAIEPLSYPTKYEEAKPGDPVLRESIAEGYKLFIGLGCISCHTDFGRQVGFYYDKWGTMVRPANLTTGIYRGGRRPVDLYYRVQVGINGAGMPATPPGPTGSPEEREKEAKKFWDLVNFLQALPYPAMLPDGVYDKIYDQKRKPQAQPSK